MPLAIPASVERAFRLRAAPAAAFARLRDVPAWAPLFPLVASIAPLDGTPGAFVWTMTPLGPPGFAVATVYACHYTFDEAAHTVVFTPVEGVGTARFGGTVALAAAPGGGTDGHVRMEATLQIPAPPFARPLVEPAVALAVRQMTADFVDRLDRALG